MELMLDFDFKLNRNQVLKTLKSYSEILKNEEIEPLYNKLLPTLYEKAQPAGIFHIGKKEENFNFKVTKGYEYIVYCIITIGDICREEINKFFSYGNIKEGMVLDTMVTSYLFQISSQLFNHIYNKAKKLNLGLSCRISPGDGEIPLQYQKYILDKLNAKNFLNLTITDNFMLSPIHSLAYIYGADKHIKLNKKDHDCCGCSNKSLCNMRKF